MKILKLKINLISVVCFILFSSSCFAQQGNITINQDQKISNLLALKKELNSNEDTPDRFKIQIYSGTRLGATSAEKDFRAIHEDLNSKIIFDTPNFKLWVGNFRTRLEADRALRKIKTDFPNALILKPKK